MNELDDLIMIIWLKKFNEQKKLGVIFDFSKITPNFCPYFSDTEVFLN